MASNIPIEVVPYDPRWPGLFELEKASLMPAFGEYLCCIEHIGSTAVPGLAAKPVIDILAGVRSISEAPRFIPALQDLGYEYIPKHEAVFPQRRYLHKILNGRHTHHLHIVEPSSDFFKVQILFRDHLRRCPEDAARYADLKYRLALEFRNDREAYTDGKSQLIQEILQSAQQHTDCTQKSSAVNPNYPKQL